jgi:signal transduction histidine kinase
MKGSSKDKTVLFVDDEPGVRRSIERVLRNENYCLLTAENGEEALGVMNSRDVHVVLTDLSMPGMNGIELLERTAISFPDTIRLILSGVTDTTTMHQAINTGNIYRYITKPWNDIELKILISQALEYHSLNAERRELLLALEKQNASLEKTVAERTQQLMESLSLAMIGRHAAHIVHNLNNTLNSMSGLFYLIGEELKNPYPNLLEIKGLCRDGSLCAEQMRHVIAEILNRSRSGDHLKTQEVDINAVIRDVDRFFCVDSQYKNYLTRKFHLMDNLPPFKGNPIQIKQILENLIKNAADAMETSSEKNLTLETFVSDGRIAILITDTGEGIEPEDIKKIFLSGYTTKAPGKGTGLGLASVKSMVESYEGSIEVFSEKGKGACFKILLPCSKG